jgi:hypothetical protein
MEIVEEIRNEWLVSLERILVMFPRRGPENRIEVDVGEGVFRCGKYVQLSK